MKKLAVMVFFFYSLALAQIAPPGSAKFTISKGTGEVLCDHMFLGSIRFIQPSLKLPTNMIIDNNGAVAWYNKSTTNVLDFKIHPNNLFTYFTEGQFFVLDSNFNLMTVFDCAGALTDIHELLITEDDRVFILCQEDSTMDLSSLTTTNGFPGDTNGVVRANTIREMDLSGVLIKEWKAWPWFDINDVDSIWFVLPSFLELNHSNSLDFRDEKMLVSHRVNNEVTLIDWTSGNVIWQMGGNNNQFIFTNDMGFVAQHDARFLSGNQISLFDNGYYHNPSNARGLVYDVDTLNMTVTRVWEYEAPGLNSVSMGSFQVLPDGDRLINYGNFNPVSNTNILCVHPDSSLRFSFDFEDTYYTYRAKCLDIPFDLNRPMISCMDSAGQMILQVSGFHSQYIWSDQSTASTLVVQDTGLYQVFVPRGIGYIGSNVLHISSLGAGCGQVSEPEAQAEHRPSPKVTGTFDLLGRPVSPENHNGIILYQYQDGSVRKVLRLK